MSETFSESGCSSNTVLHGMSDCFPAELITSSAACQEGSGLAACQEGSGRVASEEGSGIVASEEGSGIVASEEGSCIVASEEGSGIVASEEGSGIVASEEGSGIVASEEGGDLVSKKEGSRKRGSDVLPKNDKKLSRKMRKLNREKLAPKERCALCSENFSDVHTLRDHCQIHAWPCGFCDFTTFSKDDIKAHLAEQHFGISAVCEINHNSFFCLLCNARHSKNTSEDAGLSLEQHLTLTHGAEEPKVLPCNCCPSSFGEWDELFRHERADHSPENFHFRCEVCPQVLNSVGLLTAHSHKHAQVNVRRQETKAMSTGELNTAVISGRGAATKECHICGVKYGDNHGPWDHATMHRWCCLDCSFTTYDINLLAGHQKSSNHNTMPPSKTAHHYCFICNQKIPHTFKKSFCMHNASLDHLTKVHPELIPTYQCKLCPFNITSEQSNNLIKHEKTVHQEVVETRLKHFRCNMCYRIVMSRIGKEEHMMVMHKSNPVKIKIGMTKSKHECEICKRCFVNASAKAQHKKVKHDLYIL